MVLASFVLGTALRDLRRGGAAAVVAILLSALTVIVAGGARSGLTALARLTAAWRADLRVVVTLRAAAGRPDDLGSVVGAARALPGVVTVRLVSADEALADLKRHLGGPADGLDRLPGNPLPARLEITPVATLDAAGLERLVAALGRLAGVEEARAAVGWVRQVERVERGLRMGGGTLAGLLGLGAILAVLGATTAATRSRVDETAILRLVGVREVSIRGPLLLQAIVQGGAGAALGVSALLLASEVGVPWLGGWLRATLGVGPLPALTWPLTALLLGGGLGGGLAGGLAAGRP